MEKHQFKPLSFIGSASKVPVARAFRTFGFAVKPLLATINVTDRCNCKCKTCDIHTWVSPEPELRLDEIEKVFADKAMKGLDVLRITGGEPFLREDIAEIFKSAQKNTPCRVICVTTNGTIPDRVERFAREALPSRSILHFQVSIDAMDSRHDIMHGAPGSLDKALESLKRLAKIRGHVFFHLGINQTIINDNLDQIFPVSELAKKMGIGHNIFLGARYHEGRNMAVSIENGKAVPFEPIQDMSPENIESFYRAVMKLKRNSHFGKIRESSISAYMRDLSEEYLLSGERSRLLFGKSYPRPACMAMFTHFRITSRGDVIPCTILASKLAGNIRNRPIGEIWTSKDARVLRRIVKECQGCWVECDIGPSIFYSGNILPWAIRQWLTNPGFRSSFCPVKTGRPPKTAAPFT